MNILVIGSGGREHALVWKLKQSPIAKNIYVAPGNAGTSEIATNIPFSKTEEIVGWLEEKPVDFVVVGPDNYLAEGIVDTISALDIPVFGPTQAAAEIEWSKAFAKDFMHKEGIPTADYEVFDNIEKAQNYIRNQKFPLVIKASGLALGKGVVIAENLAEGESTLREIMEDKVHGDAGREIVIEEYLVGKEISIHAFCDGKNAALFPASQDHKRIFEGDKGPNTGGMGTIAPVPWVTTKHMKEIEEKIVLPTLKALEKRGSPFRGLLFPGIMITAEGPKVIEFNARFGDPETQSYMRILESDLLPTLLACAKGDLAEAMPRWSSGSACSVILASQGYPGAYEKGKVISGLDSIIDPDVCIFQAGTKVNEGKTVTNGGRVLGITATGADLKDALGKAYASIEKVSFDGMQYRKDIGAKSL